ncbi:MAG: universal stress protein [Deltaproteobacteria bacterium]|nr:universal stress protein [Deltaproteobacteria bacterium]
MLAVKRILCPTDFSQPSYEALKVAGEVARHFGAELWVMHVIPPIPSPGPVTEATFAPGFDLPLYQQELVGSSEKALQAVIKERVPPDLAVQSVLTPGDPAQEIIRTAQEHQIDLIIIATHGHTGWGRFIFGSVAEKVVRLASCPVLTLKAHQGET